MTVKKWFIKKKNNKLNIKLSFLELFASFLYLTCKLVSAPRCTSFL